MKTIRRFAPLALLALAGTGLAAQVPPAAPTTPAAQASPMPPSPDAPPAPPAAAPLAAPARQPVLVKVGIVTSAGRIVVAVEKERAPVTAANFLRYVDQKRLDGQTFYRATKVAPGFGLIQGGVRDPRLLYPPIVHEPTSRTGLSHIDGAISMARGAPGSAQADFFITVGAIPSMDADPGQPGDNLGFAVFGHVVEGMDVVRAILDMPTSPTAGVGPMKGQMLAPTVKIVSARRLPG